MHFEKAGFGDPVVLIHGLGASSFSWRDTAAALSKKYTTYNVDLLGFGKSAAPAGFAYTAKVQADEVAKFITAHKLSNPAIIGHSMGGGICLYLADQAARGAIPSLGKMVLVAPVASPPRTSPPSGPIAELATMIKLPGFDPAPFSRQLAELVLRRAYKPPPPPVFPTAQIDGYADGLSSVDQMRAFITHSDSLDEISFADSTLKGINTKTLVIWGEDDPFLSFTLAEPLKDALGDASLKPVKNCGHIPHEEQPKETNKLIEDFLK
ncbi:MAG: alpha/beta hydrolase [Xanthobacteraceae bacterium]